MRKSYFIVVLAHSVHGRIRRIHVPHYVIHVVACLAVFAAIVGIGLLSSYGRMLWKATEYNQLRAEKEALRKQNDDLKEQAVERDAQLASLGELASEVSIAFGIKRPFTETTDAIGEGHRAPRYRSSVNQFDFLRQVHLSPGSSSPWYWLENTTPSTWPVQGRLSSSFGKRLDPFLGKGAFHTGVDLAAPYGTPVVAAADGIVTTIGWLGRYGKRVELLHGRNGLSSRYAHLADAYVRPGQVVRRGQVIGRVGRSGRVTSAHLHYEVRYRGTPINPYRYLKRSTQQQSGFHVSD
jgi:murein DD-endopeptidase MepM/ murein hydrolase activator NlpD